MLTLLIKGDLHAAFKAADAHHVELTSLAHRIASNDVIASAPAEAINRVRNWFVEDVGQAPFNPGSLLHFSNNGG